MIRVMQRGVGMLATNCYMIINDESHEAILVDPADQADLLQRYLEDQQAKPVAVLLTHGHFDHIGAAEYFRDTYDIPIYACHKEKMMLNTPQMNLSAVYQRGGIAFDADIYCKEGDLLKIAGAELQVIETPGHTPGGCCYYLASEDVLFSGDSLFETSIGRTDLPGGSYSQLMQSIKEKLFVLPGQTKVYPGHGGTSTIDYEKRNNPYVR